MRQTLGDILCMSEPQADEFNTQNSFNRRPCCCSTCKMLSLVKISKALQEQRCWGAIFFAKMYIRQQLITAYVAAKPCLHWKTLMLRSQMCRLPLLYAPVQTFTITDTENMRILTDYCSKHLLTFYTFFHLALTAWFYIMFTSWSLALSFCCSHRKSTAGSKQLLVPDPEAAAIIVGKTRIPRLKTQNGNARTLSAQLKGGAIALNFTHTRLFCRLYRNTSSAAFKRGVSYGPGGALKLQKGFYSKNKYKQRWVLTAGSRQLPERQTFGVTTKAAAFKSVFNHLMRLIIKGISVSRGRAQILLKYQTMKKKPYNRATLKGFCHKG